MKSEREIKRLINSLLKEQKGKRAVVTRSISCTCLGLHKSSLYIKDMSHAERKIALERAVAKVVYIIKDIKVTFTQTGVDNKMVKLSNISILVIDKYLYVYAHCLGYVVRIELPKSTYQESTKIARYIESTKVLDVTLQSIMGYDFIELGTNRGASGSGNKYINYSFTTGTKTVVNIRAHEFHWLLAHPEHVEYLIQHDKYDTNHIKEAPNGDYLVNREFNAIPNLELTLKFLNNMVGRQVDKLIKDGKQPKMSIHELSMSVKDFCKHAGINYNEVLFIHNDGELVDRETYLPVIPKEMICRLYY